MCMCVCVYVRVCVCVCVCVPEVISKTVKTEAAFTKIECKVAPYFILIKRSFKE